MFAPHLTIDPPDGKLPTISHSTISHPHFPNYPPTSIACYGVGLDFQRIPNIFLAKSHCLSYFLLIKPHTEPVSLQIDPFPPASICVFFPPTFLQFESILFLSIAFPLFPPSSLPLSPPVSIKLPFPVPLRTRGRVVYLGVAPPAIDSCDMNNTLLTKLHHSAHRPDTRCFYFSDFF